MRLGSIIAGIILGKYALKVLKKSSEYSTDIRDIFSPDKKKTAAKPQTGAVNSSGNRGSSPVENSGSSPKAHEPDNSPGNPPSAPETVYPEFAKPDTDVPDYFTPYEGEDISAKQAHEAGFEFEGCDRYHGVDDLTGLKNVYRDYVNGSVRVRRRGSNTIGLPGCVITGYHGGEEIVKVPQTVNCRPVLKIGSRAFAEKNIREIYLPSTVMDIGDSAFENSSIEYARLSENLIRIGNSAFFSCKRLERVYLGGAKYIGDSAFYFCRKLVCARLPERVEKLGRYAFAYSGIEKLHWNRIACAEGGVLKNTPYLDRHAAVLLGDCLQQCALSGCGEIAFREKFFEVGECCFSRAQAGKVTLPKSVRRIGDRAFYTDISGSIGEVLAPLAYIFGSMCFTYGQKITVSEGTEYVTENRASTGYLMIQRDSFLNTSLEKRYLCGNEEFPLACYMVRNTLVRIELDPSALKASPEEKSDILTFEDGGQTLVMSSKIGYSVCRIPPLAPLLKVSGDLRSWTDVNDFEEIEFARLSIETLENSRFWSSKSVTLRFKFTDYAGNKTDSAVFLYVHPFPGGSKEAESLYELYNSCFKFSFDFKLYDSEILSRISSWRRKFTAARLRLEGGLYLSDEARDRYLQLFKVHRKKAEFIAKKHGDTELLNFLNNLKNY